MMAWIRLQVSKSWITILALVLFAFMIILASEAVLEIENHKFERDFGTTFDPIVAEENRIRVQELIDSRRN